MITLMRLIVCVVLISFLPACSLLSPVKSEAMHEYVLNTVPQVSIKKSSHPKKILITQPEAEPLYNNIQMIYSTRPYQVAYFAKNRWAETPPKMLQKLLMQTLESTHHFYAVSSGLGVAQYDYILNTQLLELQQLFYNNRQSEVVIKLQAQLVNNMTNQMIATKEFKAIVKAPQNNPVGGVVAANRAVAEVLREVARWCLVKIR